MLEKETLIIECTQWLLVTCTKLLSLALIHTRAKLKYIFLYILCMFQVSQYVVLMFTRVCQLIKCLTVDTDGCFWMHILSFELLTRTVLGYLSMLCRWHTLYIIDTGFFTYHSRFMLSLKVKACFLSNHFGTLIALIYKIVTYDKQKFGEKMIVTKLSGV